MFCKACGTQVADNQTFCPNCGAPIAAPQGAPQQPHQYQQQPYRAPGAPAADKKKLFSLLVSIVFGVAALFALIALIGYCVKFNTQAGLIISYVFAILACIGIALAPFFKAYTKLCIVISGAILFLGMYGVSMIGIAGSFGYLILMLGFAALAFLCWLFYTNNNLSRNYLFMFIPAGVIFLGALLNWIIGKYFTMMKYAVVFFLFDLLFDIVVIGGAVILALYLNEIRNEKSAQINIPNPPQAPRQPQQPPYQGR